MDITQYIQEGRAVLGIEFGSTRIKAVLIGEQGEPLASGSHRWENRLEEGVWTYHEEDIWNGLASCYQSLSEQVQQSGDDHQTCSNWFFGDDAWIFGV